MRMKSKAKRSEANSQCYESLFILVHLGYSFSDDEPVFFLRRFAITGRDVRRINNRAIVPLVHWLGVVFSFGLGLGLGSLLVRFSGTRK
jgi:hypothetical protein